VRVLAEAGIATPDDLRAYAGQTRARFPFLVDPAAAEVVLAPLPRRRRA
jgi:hypothetical protein